MKIEDIIKSDAFIRFYETLLEMRVRSSDRDNTILLALKYDNFEDFYDNYKDWFIVSFKDEVNLFSAVLRVFISAQLSCISPDDRDIEARERFHNFIYEAVNQNIDGMISKIKQHHPKVYEEIKEKNLRKERII